MTSLTLYFVMYRWLTLIKPILKPRTVESYTQSLDLHIIPALGDIKIRQLPKGRYACMGVLQRIREAG